MIKKLDKPLRKILNYKPDSAPKKPSKQPSKAELEKVYKFDGKRIIEVK